MKYFIFSVLSLLTFNCNADESLPPTSISSISTDWDGTSIYFMLSDSNTVGDCTSSDKRVMVLMSNPMFNEIMSVALAAFMGNKEVSFRISGCTSKDRMNGIAIAVYK